MKYLITLSVLLFCKISFGQNMAKINLKDSCIISGGVINLKDFKGLCKICPPGVKKVDSYIFSYTINPPLYLEVICKTNRFNPYFFLKHAVPGRTFMIEEIKATGADGKTLNLKPIYIGFK